MSKTKITTATQEQWNEVDRITQWWIDEQTVTQSDSDIQQAVADVWALMRLEAPLVIVVDSPLSCRIGWSVFAGVVGKEDGRNTLDNTLDNALRNTLDNTLRNTLTPPPTQYQSVWRRVWAGWYEGGKALGVQFDEEKYDLFRRWCLCCPYVAGNEKVVFVSRNPTELHWRGTTLHNESGPAFRYADGWGGYLIDNMILDEQVVMRPETQTIEQIDGEQSNDIRAIRLERYGAARYLTETGAKVLDDRAVPIEGTHEALLEDKNGHRWLWPTCPSGRICPPLRVPREINSCESASQWVAGDKPFRAIART